MISGIGIDIVEIGKVRDLVQNYPAKINSIFTPQELSFCEPRPCVSTEAFLRGRQERGENNGFSRYSMIFAAKEATLKSLNTGWEKGRDLLDIEIVPLKNNQFQVSLFQRLEEKARELSVKELKGSFSYSGDIAIAQVVALKK